jgi:hypothetical protein
MNHDSHAENPYPELNRAAGAGLCLVSTRRQFRRLAGDAMNMFATADAALRTSGFAADRPAVHRGFDAAHTAFALFISQTQSDWDAEDGSFEETPRPLRLPQPTSETPVRSRLEDILDGYLEAPDSPDFVERVFSDCARAEFDTDRTTSKRLFCISLTWGVDLRHCREELGWARRQGVFPGAEAAPSLACLLVEIARRLEDTNAPQSVALRLAAMAAGRIQAAANAYGRACCAEFEYTSVVNGGAPS